MAAQERSAETRYLVFGRTIKKIKPDVLIPIHTQCPEEFKEFHDYLRVPKNGGTIVI